MITPNKFTSLDKTIVGKMSNILLEEVDEISVTKLKELKARKFTDIGEFMLALDVLFLLGKIELDEERRTIKYVD